MVKMIVDLLKQVTEALPADILSDLGLYISLGLIGIVFICTLIAGLASSGELGKFKRCANGAVKNPTPENINANMQKMPVKVKKQYKRAMLTGTKPSDIVSIDAAVNTPYRYSAVSKMARVMIAGTVAATAIGVGFSALFSDGFTGIEALIVLLSVIVGGIFTLICSLISLSAYKGAVKAYNALTDVLDGASAVEVPRQQVTHEQPVVAPDTEDTYEEPVQEPVFEQHDYYGEQPEIHEEVVERPEVESEPEFYVHAEPKVEEETDSAEINEVHDEPIPAESVQTSADEDAAAKAAAQRRLEELRAQREAQIRAQREAAAQARAAQQVGSVSSVSTEDVIERIEQIDRDGAPLPVMKEVAMLLQKERAKPENKTPEQQKKLNEALSKLLKAMSAANKR